MVYLFGLLLFSDRLDGITGVLFALVALDVQVDQAKLVFTSHAPEPILIGQVDNLGRTGVEQFVSLRPISWAWATVEELVGDHEGITDRVRPLLVSEQSVDGLA